VLCDGVAGLPAPATSEKCSRFINALFCRVRRIDKSFSYSRIDRLLTIENIIMKAVAQVFPFLAFAMLGRPGASIASLAMQLSLVGWLPAAVWASRSVEDHCDQRRLQHAMAQRRWHGTPRG
jgi:hypothetical protein